MAIQFWVPGSTNITVGGSHLGYVEEEVPIELMGYHSEVAADFAGPMMPADVQWLGMSAMISFNLVKYDEAILNTLKAYINGGTMGQGAAGSIGTLMLGESKTFPLVLTSAYGNTQSAFTGMNTVWTFPNAYPVDSFSFGLGMKVKKERMTMRALPVIATDGSFTLYTVGAGTG